jgi:hypothetical protein
MMQRTVEPDLETNPRLMLVEALMFAIIAVIGAAITYQIVRAPAQPPETWSVPGMIEAETLPVIEKTSEFGLVPQDTSPFTSGRWSGNQHLFVATRAEGDALTLGLPAVEPGTYALTLYLTRSYDYGIVRVLVNGVPVGGPVDLWAWGVEATGPLTLGNTALSGQDDVIRFEIAGRNERAAAPFYQFGIDGLVLSPAP